MRVPLDHDRQQHFDDGRPLFVNVYVDHGEPHKLGGAWTSRPMADGAVRTKVGCGGDYPIYRLVIRKKHA